MGELIRISKLLLLKPPVFNVEYKEGRPNNPKFICHAQFADFLNETVIASTKNTAAIKMLVKLKKMPDINNQLILKQNEGNKIPAIEISENQNKKHGEKYKQTIFYKLRNSNQPTTRMILNPDLEENMKSLNKKIFESLIKEENIQVTIEKMPKHKRNLYSYFKISQNNATKIHLILLISIVSNYVILTLNTIPILTFSAFSSISLNDSLNNACFNALVELRSH